MILLLYGFSFGIYPLLLKITSIGIVNTKFLMIIYTNYIESGISRFIAV